MTLPRLATAIVLISIFAMAVRVPASPDMWWHLRCGEVQWRTQRVLQEDIFSHTAAGAPWVNQSWLPQLAMYALYSRVGEATRVGLADPRGFAALALAVAALVAATFGLLWLVSSSVERSTPATWQARQWQVSTWWMPYWRGFVILWAAIASGPVWAARPHLLTLFFSALWMWLLERWRRGSSVSSWRALAWLPLLMLVWANCHAGYIIGLLLLGIEMVAALPGTSARTPARDGRSAWADLRPLLLITLLCILAALLNPQGIHLLLMPFRTLGSAAQQTAVAEWASPDFHTRETWPFLGLLLATWAALALSDQRPHLSDLLRALAFTALALRSMRYMGLAAVVLAPLLVHYGARVFRRVEARWGRPEARTRPARGSPALNWAILALVLVGAGFKVALPLHPATIARVHRQRFPVEAVDHIRGDTNASPGVPAGLSADVLPETLFNDYGWGGYLIWTLYPDTPVFIDGRADPYGDDLIAAYRRTITARPDWEETLDQYGVHSVLIATDSALASVLREREGWQEHYADRLAALFVRNPGGR